MKIAITLILVLMLTITGCGNKDSEESIVEESVVTEILTPEPTVEPTSAPEPADHPNDDYTILSDHIELVGLEMVQADGDDHSIVEALNPYYVDSEEIVTISFENWDADFYYMEDYTNRKKWKVDRSSFAVTEGWD